MLTAATAVLATEEFLMRIIYHQVPEGLWPALPATSYVLIYYIKR